MARHIYYSIPALKHNVYKYQGVLTDDSINVVDLEKANGVIVKVTSEYISDRIWEDGTPYVSPKPMRQKVAEWLESLVDITDVRPVIALLRGREYEGAVYTQRGETRFYLIGDRPKKRKVCFNLYTEDSKMDHEWFVIGYVEKWEELTIAQQEYSPFGNHFVLGAWDIEGDPGSKIDDYEDHKYQRIGIDLKFDNPPE